MVSSLVIIPYYLLQTEPLWRPTMWISIHAPRAIAFTGDQQFLYDKTFSALSPQQFDD